MKLVVIDFDGVVTVANVHTHNQLYMANFVSYTQSVKCNQLLTPLRIKL